MPGAKKRGWIGASVALLALAGYAAILNDRSCAEKVYRGGRLIECPSTRIFQPSVHGPLDEGESTGIGSFLLPPAAMGLLGAMLYPSCETIETRTGHWTVCDDGFSLLERETAPVAQALRIKARRDHFAKARTEAEQSETGFPVVQDTDCGQYRCSEYADDADDPERDAYLSSLSLYERQRLGAVIRVWRSQQLDRELEKARADNTLLLQKLHEIEVREAELHRADAVAKTAAEEPESL